jgi:hypothetical protein
MMLFAVSVNAASGESLLDVMKYQIFQNELNADEGISTAVVPKEEPKELTPSQKIFWLSLKYRACTAQGNTYDECQLLTRKDESFRDDYDFRDPHVPSFKEGVEDFFINLNIRN